MSHEITLRSARPPVVVHWYHRVVCTIARQFVRAHCKNRAADASSKLSETISRFSDLRTRGNVLAAFGPPDYSMDGSCSAWTSDDGTLIHPDLVDTYTLSHCTFDVNYIDGSIRQIMAGVAIDGWDVCSNAYLDRK